MILSNFSLPRVSSHSKHPGQSEQHIYQFQPLSQLIFLLEITHPKKFLLVEDSSGPYAPTQCFTMCTGFPLIIETAQGLSDAQKGLDLITRHIISLCITMMSHNTNVS